jgi:CDP-diacylglycerol--glycerol-3-phosphate 3-phosphatidyltransferase
MLKLIPNILTFSRLLLTVIFLIMVLYSPKVASQALFLDVAFVLFVVAGLTDIVDGIMARRLNVTSKFGRMVDPLVDKVLVCGSFICFALIQEPKLFNFSPATLTAIHWSVAATLIAREAYVTVLRHIAEARGINFAASIYGKIKMFTHSFAIGTVLIKMAHVQTATWGYYFTIVTFTVMLTITVVSGLSATRRSSFSDRIKES